jgi:hypothetical protein
VEVAFTAARPTRLTAEFSKKRSLSGSTLMTDSVIYKGKDTALYFGPRLESLRYIPDLSSEPLQPVYCSLFPQRRSFPKTLPPIYSTLVSLDGSINMSLPFCLSSRRHIYI